MSIPSLKIKHWRLTLFSTMCIFRSESESRKRTNFCISERWWRLSQKVKSSWRWIFMSQSYDCFYELCVLIYILDYSHKILSNLTFLKVIKTISLFFRASLAGAGEKHQKAVETITWLEDMDSVHAIVCDTIKRVFFKTDRRVNKKKKTISMFMQYDDYCCILF